MATKFCTDCGKKVEYKFNPPNFCSDCGNAFNASYANEKSPISKKVKSIEKLNEDETDAEFVPKISKLEYEIDTFGSEMQKTIGSLGGKQATRRRKNIIKNINDL